jgi:hypothetical protein
MPSLVIRRMVLEKEVAVDMVIAFVGMGGALGITRRAEDGHGKFKAYASRRRGRLVVSIIANKL